MCEHRKTVCAGCGIPGYRADTTAGEIVRDGSPVDVVPNDGVILLAGRADGSDTDNLFCEDCANETDDDE